MRAYELPMLCFGGDRASWRPLASVTNQLLDWKLLLVALPLTSLSQSWIGFPQGFVVAVLVDGGQPLTQVVLLRR